MSDSTTLAETSEAIPTRQRRALGALGIGMVAAIADVLATPEAASAGLSSPCCHLATNTQCSASCSGGCTTCYNYHCPSGSYKEYWWCFAGSRLIGCGECQKTGSDCWSGGNTYTCSIWWDDNACP